METKERDYADSIKIEVTGVEVQTNMNNVEEVKKVVFETNKGSISYKPKIAKQEYRDGLKIGSIVPALVDDIPDIIRSIAKEASNKGKCIVTASYHIWNTEKDGEPVTYRYVQGSTMLDKWKIEEQTNTEEQVG